MGKSINYQSAKEDFLKMLVQLNYAQSTIEGYKHHLQHLEAVLDERQKSNLRWVSQATLRDFYEALLKKPWKEITKASVFNRIKKFITYLTDHKGLYLINPAEGLRYKSVRAKVTPIILSQEEMGRLILSPLAPQPLGIRDWAILELMYSCGVRISELLNLKVKNIDFKNNLLFIEQGKGGKDRVLPVGKRAAYALEVYLHEVRPLFQGSNQETVFINRSGEPLAMGELRSRLKDYGHQVGIKKRIYPHLIRHSMATHFLDEGAPIMAVRGILGHEHLNTTQFYTHIAKANLKKIHARYHPRGKWVYED